MVRSIFTLIRPSGWLKNFFIFLPIFFSGQIFQVQAAVQTSFAFLVFCLLASSVYVLNDILDVDDDRNHPQKKFRPIASGAISTATALMVCGALIVGAFVGAIFLLSPDGILLMAGYLLINLAYSLGLKHIPVVDVFIVSSGFVIRVILGAVASHVQVSNWLMIMTVLVTLILALGKRKDDVAVFIETGKTTRKVIHGYNDVFLDVSLALVASVVVVSYIMYTVTGVQHPGAHEHYLYMTSFIVLFGVLRYLQQVLVEKKKADPTELILSDHVLQVAVITWILAFGLLVYLE